MRTIKVAAAALAAVALAALFFGWCSWWSSPATWIPESRFFAGLIAIGAGGLAAKAAYELTEDA